ncbi:MAG TPA: hypothetical protein VE961_21585 [Pyrinomonadaceae bacterium]|nr:hypothetical protein [Pyrinomonadaceae bacterium]
MRRREFISLVGAMTAAWPLVTHAHQAGMKRGGLLMSTAQTDLEETFSGCYRKSINISRKTTGACRLTPEEFHTAYPKLRAWIQKTLEFYEKNAKPVASMRFVLLPLYFDPSTLETAKFITIDRLPMPPLSSMGLSRFAVFEEGDFNGITYLDRYFIKQTVVTEEAIHFHELIHVIQWRLLGPEDFLAAYANGLDEFGYENSPLEKMAYDAEAAFKQSFPIFDAEKFVAEQLGRLP